MPAYSSQRLIADSPEDLNDSETHVLPPPYLTTSLRNDRLSRVAERMGLSESYRKTYISFLILCAVNFINYVDRFSLSGVLDNISVHYSISVTTASIIQTLSTFSFLLASIFFCYLGDRYNRKSLFIAGLIINSLATFTESFVNPQQHGFFTFLRVAQSVGESSCAILAPTIIADLCAQGYRTKVLTVFYIVVPIGSGLGYILSSQLSNVIALWQWSMRFVPPMGIVLATLAVIYLKVPPRGYADGATTDVQLSSIFSDIYDLYKTPTFVWTTLAWTSIAFCFGAICWWGPTFLQMAIELQSDFHSIDATSLFGTLVLVGGVVGVTVGFLVSYFRRQNNPDVDPLICAGGCFLTIPFAFLGLAFLKEQFILANVLFFLAASCIFVSLTAVTDILLYVVIPTRRAIGIAAQIVVSYLLGVMPSPYLCNLVFEAVMKHMSNSDSSALDRYHSLQYALFMPFGLLTLGGICFLIAATQVEKDRIRCDLIIRGVLPQRHLFPSPTATSAPVRLAADHVLPTDRAYPV